MGGAVRGRSGVWVARAAAIGQLLQAAALCTAVLAIGSCAHARRPNLSPVPAAAAEAFAHARALALRADSDEAIRDALLEAARLDPTWIAPRRMLDDRAVAELRGTSVLAEHRARIAAGPLEARDLYLAGRLEGAEGSVRFPQAIAVDPDLAWPHHALSVDREFAGDLRGAIAAQRRALDRGRSGYERALFARRLASLLARADEPRQALTVLELALLDPLIDPLSRHEVEFDLARYELDPRGPDGVVEKGYRRALVLIASEATKRDEATALLGLVLSGRRGRSEAAWVFDVAEALRANARLAVAPHAVDLLLAGDFEDVLAAVRGADPAADPMARLEAAFLAGTERAGIEAWLAELPRVALDGDGQPRDERLRRVVASVRASDAVRGDEALLATADACLDAGWFGPAAVLARRVGRAGPLVARARDLEQRALAAEALLAEIDQILAATAGRDIAWEPQRGALPLLEPIAAVREGADLDAVLERFALLVARYGAALGWNTDEVAQQVRASPRLDFGPFGTVVVPGPVFVARDEELGIGKRGEAVPGLADVLGRLGRMGLFGQPPFGGVDGTILRRLWSEERAGEHLGVPWSGGVIWCDGVDALSRRSRSGLDISGAALHEGYWVDVGAERRRLVAWRHWQRWIERRGAESARRTVDEFALACDLGAGGLALFERARLPAMLGAADALRIAVLLDRRSGAPDARGDLVTLDELVEVVATHEEGHLTDRTRFLPLGRDVLGMAAIAASEVFSPLGIERRLEYRAEAIALASVPDPRLVLVELLEAAAVDARIETVHAHAYRALLRDFLAEWNQRLERDPSAWPDVSREHYLAHQLHRLSIDEIRSMALAVARREGLVRGS